MTRQFVYDNRTFPDPDESLSIDQVKESMANFFPELATADHTTKKDGDNEVITFNRKVGTKGTASKVETAEEKAIAKMKEAILSYGRPLDLVDCEGMTCWADFAGGLAWWLVRGE